MNIRAAITRDVMLTVTSPYWRYCAEILHDTNQQFTAVEFSWYFTVPRITSCYVEIVRDTATVQFLASQLLVEYIV